MKYIIVIAVVAIVYFLYKKNQAAKAIPLKEEAKATTLTDLHNTAYSPILPTTPMPATPQIYVVQQAASNANVVTNTQNYLQTGHITA